MRHGFCLNYMCKCKKKPSHCISKTNSSINQVLLKELSIMRLPLYSCLFILFSFIFISCNHNEVVLEKSQTIRTDSFYLSCKINGERLILQSPTTAADGGGFYTQRLYKLNNNPKDSTIIGQHYDYSSPDYEISIGFSKCLLLDTVIAKGISSPDCKKQIFSTGKAISQFMPPYLAVESLTSKYTGFYITILDRKTNIKYKSYYDNMHECNNSTQYNYFLTNSTFNISKSMQLYPLHSSESISAWFIESTFNCALYDFSNDSSQPTTKPLTDGILRGSF